jgi:hypothetical protein
MAGAQGERWLARVGGDEVHTATRCCRIRLQPLACRSQQSTDRTGSRVSPLVYGSPCSRVCRLDPKSQRRTCRARWLLTSLRNRLRPRPSLSTPYAHERNRAISLPRSASETPTSAEREWRSTRPRPASWYRRAAERGDTDAQIKLASLYRTGAPGIDRDLVAALRWLTPLLPRCHPENGRRTSASTARRWPVR